MELLLIKPNSTEWEFMWEWLEKHPINEGLEEPSLALNNNEGWQYVGSYKHNNTVISSFRHKSHPKTNSIHNLSVEHINFDISCIHKLIKK